MFKKQQRIGMGFVIGAILWLGFSACEAQMEVWYQSAASSNGMLSRLSDKPEMQKQRAYEHFGPGEYTLRVCYPRRAGTYCEFTAEGNYKEMEESFPAAHYRVRLPFTHIEAMPPIYDVVMKKVKSFCDNIYPPRWMKKEQFLNFSLVRPSDHQRIESKYPVEPDVDLLRTFFPAEGNLGLQITEKLKEASFEEASCVQFTEKPKPRR